MKKNPQNVRIRFLLVSTLSRWKKDSPESRLSRGLERQLRENKIRGWELRIVRSFVDISSSSRAVSTSRVVGLSGRINYQPRHWKYFCCRSDSTFLIPRFVAAACSNTCSSTDSSPCYLNMRRSSHGNAGVIEVYLTSNWTIISLLSRGKKTANVPNKLPDFLVSRFSEELRNCPRNFGNFSAV